MSALQLRHPPLLPPSIEHEYGSTYSLWHDMYALQVSWWKLKVQGMIAENGERNRQDQSFEEEARIQRTTFGYIWHIAAIGDAVTKVEAFRSEAVAQ